MSLNGLLIIYGCLAFINLVLMVALHFLHDRKGYYKTAAMVWIGILLAFLADGYISTNIGNVMHIFGIPFMGITLYSIAKLTSELYKVELPLQKLGWFAFGSWAAGALLHFLFAAPFEVVSLVIMFGLVFPALTSFYKLFLIRKQLTVIDKMFAFIILADVIHLLDYPFLRLVQSFAVFGFSLGILLVYLIAMLLPIIINRRIAADLNEVLETRVQERTEQLLDAREKLVTSAKMSALGEMAGGVAHEINTPLAVISMVSEQVQELLAEDPIDKTEIIKMNASIGGTVKKISTIVQGLRVFARDGGQDPFSSASVRSIVESTLALCEEKMKHNSIKVTVDEIASDFHLLCREVQISQVLLNLLSNACDAIAAQPEKWIKIEAVRVGGNIRILITDSGHGLPAHVQKKLFQPFFTTKEIGKGTGLGLSISKGIMDVHQGSLTCDTTCPNTRFIIECPAAPASAAQAS